MNIDKSLFSGKDPKKELMAFDDSCVDLVVTAPPVFSKKGNEAYCNNTSYSWDTFDEYIDYMGMVFSEVYRMLKNQHYCILQVGDDTAIVGDRPRDSKTFSYAAHFIKLLEWIGFTYVSEYTIDTGRKVLPEVLGSSRYPFTAVPVSRNKQVLVFIKKESAYAPIPCPRCGNKETIVGYGYSDKGDKKWLCNECSQVFFERGVIMNSHKREKNIIPPDVVDRWSRGVVQIAPMFSEESRQRHLFSEVAEMAVMFYSGVGDVVLDPFSGTGSAIMTAVKHKRRFMCFERDEYDRKMFFGALRVLSENLENVRKETECVEETE